MHDSVPEFDPDGVAPNLGAIAPKLGATPETNSVAVALFGKTRQAILALLYGHPDRIYHARQIARIIGSGQGSTHRELQQLTAAGILLRYDERHLVRYQANRHSPIFAEIQGLVIKTVGVADTLRMALASLRERTDAAFVFGSMAEGGVKSDSDIDVLVIGDVSFAEVAAALGTTQDALGREVNPSVYAPTEFAQKLATGNHFLKTVMSKPKIWLIGDDNDLAELAEKRMAGRAPN